MNGWQRITALELAARTEKGGWQWIKREKSAAGSRLALVAPDGQAWDFKMLGGIFIRQAQSAQEVAA